MAADVGKDGKPILQLASQEEWEAWLDAEHGTSDGVWLKFAKKGSGVETVVYAEALEVALCYGWIDRSPASTSASTCRSSPRVAPAASGRASTATRSRS